MQQTVNLEGLFSVMHTKTVILFCVECTKSNSIKRKFTIIGLTFKLYIEVFTQTTLKFYFKDEVHIGELVKTLV